MTNPMELFIQSPLAYLLSVGAFGLVIGSFLNVVIHRIPIMLERQWTRDCQEHLGAAHAVQQETPYNLLSPPSTCPECGHRIRAWENIPVLSYLFLRGKCARCGASIAMRYPLVEILTAGLSVMVAWRFGLSLATLAALALTWTLIALAMIDLETKLLPDTLTLPLLWLGLLVNLDGTFAELQASVIGAAAGYLSLWSIYQLFRLLTGKEGMGYGDFKLLAVLGAWLGWAALPQIILLSTLIGATVGIGLIAIRGRDRNVPIPFGPYLAAAGWIALMWGPQINHWYLDVALR